MSSYLQQQLQTRMQNMRLSICGLEKKAGLKKNIVRNVLLGKSRNPRTESLQAIADVFKCTIEDLVGHTAKIPVIKVIAPPSVGYNWNANLYEDAMKLVSKSSV